jgi:hypothetical protein
MLCCIKPLIYFIYLLLCTTCGHFVGSPCFSTTNDGLFILQDIQEQLREYDRRVSTLALAASDIIPLPLRSTPVRSPVRVRALCSCHQPEVLHTFLFLNPK